MAAVEANKASFHRLVDEALNRGILDVVDEMLGEFAEQVKALIRVWRSAFPDFHTTIETMVGEGDWVAVRLRHQGTHEGEFFDLAPTGQRVEFRSMVFNRFTDGGRRELGPAQPRSGPGTAALHAVIEPLTAGRQPLVDLDCAERGPVEVDRLAAAADGELDRDSRPAGAHSSFDIQTAVSRYPTAR